MCNKCYPSPCHCSHHVSPCGTQCDPCEGDCPVKLDFKCVIYNLDNDSLNSLSDLGLTNGATLRLVIETMAEKIKQLNLIDHTLTCLRANYTITTLKNFTQAVDTELCLLKDSVDAINLLSNVNLVANDSSSIDFSTSGTLDHTLTASVKISNQSNNLITILSDGLFVTPQTLSINYSTKKLSISNGNTVDLAGIMCAPSGYLGNVSTDPTAPLDGNYWFNTVQNKLKIKVNNTVKEILTA